MEMDPTRDLQQLHAIQKSMTDEVGSSFTESEREALRVVIRLTMEFHSNVAAKEIDNYVCESVFSGIDAFTSLVHAYGVLEGAEVESRLRWKAASISSLKLEFKPLYVKFVKEEAFNARCRLLLDLFKLQIAIAAITYDCTSR